MASVKTTFCEENIDSPNSHFIVSKCSEVFFSPHKEWLRLLFVLYVLILSKHRPQKTAERTSQSLQKIQLQPLFFPSLKPELLTVLNTNVSTVWRLFFMSILNLGGETFLPASKTIV